MSVSDMDELKVQTRPYEWVEFKDVSLRPDFTSSHQITSNTLSTRNNKKPVHNKTLRSNISYAEIPENKVRTVHFPDNVSLGSLSIGKLQSLNTNWWGDWQHIGLARGRITIPTDKSLHMYIKGDALEHLSYLSELSPSDIQVITMEDIEDEDLKYISNLTGLKQLTLHILPESEKNFSGEGLAYLANLTTLESLNIYRFKIKDEQLQYLSSLKGLRRLGIFSGDSITDTGLKVLKKLPSLEQLAL